MSVKGGISSDYPYIDEAIFDNLPSTILISNGQTDERTEVIVQDLKNVASGSFGVVYEGFIRNREHIALKKVLEDRRYKNRELQIMKTLEHNHITTLLYYFYSRNIKKEQIFLNLIMEYVPQSLTRVLRFYHRNNSFLPIQFTKLYMYQMMRGLNYIHQLGICHRDMKPQNILIDPAKSLLRICDFGSAKKLISTESNVAYICSRYYRAPELIFGATNYTNIIDVWSSGCVFAEILMNKPIFPGETSVDQMVEIIKIIGTPSKEEILDMNPNYQTYNFPSVNPPEFISIFSNPGISSDIINLLRRMLCYSPRLRANTLDVMLDVWFDELRAPGFSQSIHREIPPLFDFNSIELKDVSSETRKLLKPETDLEENK